MHVSSYEVLHHSIDDSTATPIVPGRHWRLEPSVSPGSVN